MANRASWIDGRVDVLLAALDELGMSSSRADATDLIEERVAWVASQMGISKTSARRYLTDDALHKLAVTMVFELAEETPGADVLHAPRDAAVPTQLLGRCIAGLAEATLVRLQERDDVEHIRSTCAQLAQALSALGQVLSDAHAARPDAATPPAAVVMMPPGLVNRTARYLEAAAELVSDGIMPEAFDEQLAGQLSATFRRDAGQLRACARGTGTA